ncbi:MAG: hypothetical protein QM775_01150 [Pirellulales bacterium]
MSLERKELDGRKALEITDLWKRHKFLTTQEFGGRLLALRWVLESPPQALSSQAGLQRQALLTQFPAYEKLSQQAAALRAELGRMPIIIDDPEQAKLQAAKLAELEKASRDQEIMLKVMAVRRLPADIVFPPIRTVEEVQKALPKEHGLLVFFTGAAQLVGLFDDRREIRLLAPAQHAGRAEEAGRRAARHRQSRRKQSANRKRSSGRSLARRFGRAV